MLDTLRAYGAKLRAEAGEQDTVAAALAACALQVAEEAAAGLKSRAGEVAAARWLDVEDLTMRQVLAWAVDRDAVLAVRLADALGWWWSLRGRQAGQYRLLGEVAGRAEPGSEGWCIIQVALGRAAFFGGDVAGSLGHFAAVLDAAGDRGPSRVLVDVLTGRSVVLLNMGRLAEGTEDGRRALAMARDLGYLTGEGMALQDLGIAESYSGDHDGSVELIRQQQLITGMPGTIARAGYQVITGVLMNAGDLAGADSACAEALALCRESGDLLNLPWFLMVMADLDVQAGRFEDAAAHLREGLQIVMRGGDFLSFADSLWPCGLLCAATGRHAEAATVFAALDAYGRQQGLDYETPADARRRAEALSAIRQALGPDLVRAAEERGAAMSLATAAEYALMLTAPAPPPAAAGPGLGGLSARERELVTLVAQGRTNAQIAAQLDISVRTVGSHLDRIRDKTGCRRRADLTRLALTKGLV